MAAREKTLTLYDPFFLRRNLLNHPTWKKYVFAVKRKLKEEVIKNSVEMLAETNFTIPKTHPAIHW